MGISPVQKLSITGGLIGELFGQLVGEKSTHLSGSDRRPAEVTFSLEIDPVRHHYLNDHAIGGKLVLPATCALELLCEAAAGLYPGYEVVFVDNFQVLGGITFEGKAKDFRLVIKQTSDANDMVAVTATLFSQEMRHKIHFRANITLLRACDRSADPNSYFGRSTTLAASDGTVTGANLRPADLFLLINKPLRLPPPEDIPNLAEVYSDWLFHGPLFHGISKITNLGRPGIDGNVIGTDPVFVLSPPNSYEWVFDPILLDSAMQLAAIWVKRYMNMQTLPTGFKSMLFARKLDLRKVTVQVYFADDVVPNDLICDLVIRDQEGIVVAAIKGLTGVAVRDLSGK
jgi:hypothetical protein